MLAERAPLALARLAVLLAELGTAPVLAHGLAHVVLDVGVAFTESTLPCGRERGARAKLEVRDECSYDG